MKNSVRIEIFLYGQNQTEFYFSLFGPDRIDQIIRKLRPNGTEFARFGWVFGFRFGFAHP